MRRVAVSYLGDAENCGSWRSQFTLRPGRLHAETLTGAHLCTVEQA